MAGAERRAVVLLIDGLGDVALPRLAGATPLQAAATPALDALAAAGVTGLMDAVEPGRACGSDTAHLALLGYDPRGVYRGRGAFESLGAGCAMAPGDVAFKCNFACLDGEDAEVVAARRVDRSFEAEGPRLCESLDGAPWQRLVRVQGAVGAAMAQLPVQCRRGGVRSADRLVHRCACHASSAQR